MNDTSTNPNSGDNLYVPPPIHQNKYDLDSNSTQTSQTDTDALKAQQEDQTGMAQPSMPQQKPKKEYVFHYHQPGEEFAPPSQSKPQFTEGYVPIFQKREGPNPFESAHAAHPYQAQKFTSSSSSPCQNCNRCAECSLRRDREAREWKKRNEEDGCTCCVKWTMCICCGLCIAVLGGEGSDFPNIFEENKKEEDPRNQNPYRM